MSETRVATFLYNPNENREQQIDRFVSAYRSVFGYDDPRVTDERIRRDVYIALSLIEDSVDPTLVNAFYTVVTREGGGEFLSDPPLLENESIPADNYVACTVVRPGVYEE